MQWIRSDFQALSTWQLYDLLKLRTDVFVVEQHCPYPELDNLDRHPETYHLLGYRDEVLIAYARLLPAGLSYPEVSIGRVVCLKSERGKGLGNALIKECFHHIKKLWQDAPITIGAQYQLVDFYRSHGFETISEKYLEDDIYHIDMTRR